MAKRPNWTLRTGIGACTPDPNPAYDTRNFQVRSLQAHRAPNLPSLGKVAKVPGRIRPNMGKACHGPHAGTAEGPNWTLQPDLTPSNPPPKDWTP